MSNTPERVDIEVRQMEVLERVLGGKTQRVIAKELGVSVATVCNDLAAAMQGITEQKQVLADRYRTIHLERLEALYAGVQNLALKGHKDSFDSAVKVLDREARLLGLDAPTKQELSGPDGGPIQVTGNEIDSLYSRLQAIKSARDGGRADAGGTRAPEPGGPGEAEQAGGGRAPGE